MNNSITEGKIGTSMLRFFFPILLGSLFQQIYNTADTLIVGRYLGKIALSAVGASSGMIVMIVNGVFVGLSSGASVLVAQYFGAGDESELQKTVHTVIVFSVICGALVSILGIAFTPEFLLLLKAPEETLEQSVVYLRVYFAGMIVNMIYNVGSGILRAVGDSKRPFLFLVVCCMLNIVLDLLFILVFHMGVFGAGFATILSQAVSAGLILFVMFRREESYQLRMKKMKLDRQTLKRILAIGLPAGFQAIIYGVSNGIIQVAVNGLGTDYVAAWATYFKIDGVFWMTVSAFGIVGATFVGQNYGAGLLNRVRKCFYINLAQAFTVALVLCAVTFAIAPWLFPLFSKDPGVNAIGTAMMRYLIPFYMLSVCMEVYSGLLRGIGDTFVPMLISLIIVCGLRSIWILVMMPIHNDMYTMMRSYPISWSVASIVFIIYTKWFSGFKAVFKKEEIV